jgi:phage gpG-like protein
VNRNTVQIGFAQPYATFHEFGTQHMPRRGLLFADPEAGTLAADDTDSILEIVHGYLAMPFD